MSRSVTRVARGLLVAGLSAALGLGAVGVAGASTTSGSGSATLVSLHRSHSKKTTTTTTTTTLALTPAAYQKSLESINSHYAKRVAKALARYRRARAHARGARAKLRARSKYRRALVSATNEREVELEALGPVPTTLAGGDTQDSGDH